MDGKRQHQTSCSNRTRVTNCCCLVAKSRPNSFSMLWTIQPTGLLYPWDLPRQEYWSGLPLPLQGTFLTQGYKKPLTYCPPLLTMVMIFPVVTYRCESWTIKKAEHQGTHAAELWSWRRLLRVPWAAERLNQSILKEINPEYSLEGLTLKLKLQYFGRLI